MTLQQLVDIVEIFSGIAVAISLVYLAFQLHQNARHQRGAISHSRSQHVQLTMQTTAASEPMMKVLLRGWAGDTTLSPVETNQFHWFVGAIFTMFQDTFHQRRNGMVDPLMYDSACRTMRFQMGQPGVRAVWLLARPAYEPSFVAFIDQMMRDTPAAFTADMSEAWKRAVQGGEPAGG